MEDLTSILSTLGIVGGGGVIFGQLVLSSVKKKISDVDRIPGLESRVSQLEREALLHNETKDAVIRMAEQIKNLSEQVKSLNDLIMRKVIKNYD